MNFLFISKKNAFILFIFIMLLFHRSSKSHIELIPPISATTEKNNAIPTIETITQSNSYPFNFNTNSKTQANILPQIKTYLQSKTPITDIYKEPLVQDDVYNFLLKKVGAKDITETILFFVEKENLSIETVFALVFTESKFNPHALNANPKSQDIGLFQLNSQTFRHLTQEELFELETNVKLGIQYLKYGYSLMPNTEKALAVYNAGPSRPLRGIIPPITQTYIKKIMLYTKILIQEFTQYITSEYFLSSTET